MTLAPSRRTMEGPDAGGPVSAWLFSCAPLSYMLLNLGAEVENFAHRVD